MARLALIPSSDADSDDEGTAAAQAVNRQVEEPTASFESSPEVSDSSDKENLSSRRTNRRRRDKEMVTDNSGLPTPNSNPAMSPRANKRRRLVDANASTPVPAGPAREDAPDEFIDMQFYDPDQDIEERRAVRKGFRDLNRQLDGSRSEYLSAENRGLQDTLHEANRFFSSVKQTSDATLDSRLLVLTADISYRKTTQLTLGDTAQGVDVDEFVSKCISFMRNGEGAGNTTNRSGSLRRRRRATVAGSDVLGSEEEEANAEEGDPLDWELLGRKACFPHNVRPPVTGFLLGPLSVEKRQRAQRVQRTRQPRRDPADVDRAQELKATDIEKVENSNLTVLCTRIRTRLVQVQTDGQAAVEAAAAEAVDDDDHHQDLSPAQMKTLMARHSMCDDGGVGFFQFIINPHSFGQTVENLFYVSFLIRDGSVGIGEDSDHLPTLHATDPRKIPEIKEQGVQKHQAVFNLDWSTWEELIKAFDITKPIIPHREIADEVIGQAATGGIVGASGWYG